MCTAGILIYHGLAWTGGMVQARAAPKLSGGNGEGGAREGAVRKISDQMRVERKRFITLKSPSGPGLQMITTGLHMQGGQIPTADLKPDLQ